MSTCFRSKQEALAIACAYAGVTESALVGIVPERRCKYHPLDDEHKHPDEIEVYTIKNKNGEEATFGIGKFRDGVDLWIIAENGLMMRV